MASETKDRILDVAERLFADRGYPATSLRDITAEAAVNLASVNYHFGAKESLLAALLERRFAPLNRRRLELLDEIEVEVGAGRPAVEEVLRAFLAPPFEMQQKWGASGRTFLRLVGRLHAETNDEHRATYLRHFEEVRRRFTSALHRALPHLEATDVHWRMMFLMGSMAFAMVEGLTPRPGGPPPRDPDEVLDALLCFAAAGVAAPSPARVPIDAGRPDRPGFVVGEEAPAARGR
ncbi:MAG: TetR family transcriptional regulator [Acidobacteria bacterium]|nr:TetR family transcriptional regulator [Acidobacteriota bacterium]